MSNVEINLSNSSKLTEKLKSKGKYLIILILLLIAMPSSAACCSPGR